jgi:hypothetical protein
MSSVVIAGNTSGTVTLLAPDIAGTTTLTLPTTSGTLVTTAGGSTVPFALGSASAPSITFTGDTNTGIFSPGADTIAFSEGGVESMRIDSSGNVGIGVSSIDAKLDISGGGSTSSAIALTNNDNATISARYSLVFQADRNNNIGGRSFDWKFGGKGYTDGTTQMYLTQSGNLAFNSGYGSVAVAYGCRAWVRFNGTGTPSIAASGNISSITDDGVGLYTLNFTNAMPDANYAGACNTSFAAGNNGAIDSVGQIYEPATGFAKVVFGLTNGSKRDHGYNLVLIVR